MYLLDSNACITYLRRRHHPLQQRIDRTPARDILLCTPVLAELQRGVHRSTDPAREQARVQAFITRFVILPFDASAAVVAGQIQATLDAVGLPIGTADAYIAAIARANSLILITHNVREFSRVIGLVYEDWQAHPME